MSIKFNSASLKTASTASNLLEEESSVAPVTSTPITFKSEVSKPEIVEPTKSFGLTFDSTKTYDLEKIVTENNRANASSGLTIRVYSAEEIYGMADKIVIKELGDNFFEKSQTQNLSYDQLLTLVKTIPNYQEEHDALYKAIVKTLDLALNGVEGSLSMSTDSEDIEINKGIYKQYLFDKKLNDETTFQTIQTEYNAKPLVLWKEGSSDTNVPASDGNDIGGIASDLVNKVNSLLAGKVDKVEGYSLSKNDFSDAYKGIIDNLDSRFDAKANTTSVQINTNNISTLSSKLNDIDTYNKDMIYTKEEVDRIAADISNNITENNGGTDVRFITLSDDDYGYLMTNDYLLIKTNDGYLIKLEPLAEEEA